MFKEDTSMKLTKKHREAFHMMVAHALHLSKRTRLDIQPTVVALCTRVTNAGKNDWNKSVCMMKFSSATVNDEWTVSAEQGIDNLEWHIDVAFAVHPNFRKSHGRHSDIQGRHWSNQCSIDQTEVEHNEFHNS